MIAHQSPLTRAPLRFPDLATADVAAVELAIVQSYVAGAVPWRTMIARVALALRWRVADSAIGLVGADMMGRGEIQRATGGEELYELTERGRGARRVVT